MSWKSSYQKACADANHPIRPSLDIDDLTSVALPGNTRENFNNKVTDAETSVLSIALSTSPSVVSLDLSYNNITNAGAVAIAEVIRSTSTLQVIGLAYNNIGSLGCRAIADALMMSMTVTALSLHGNDIEDDGGVALGVMLRGNNNLTSLDVARTGISTRGLVSIFQAVANHPSLLALFLDRPLLPGVHDVACVSQHLSTMIQKNTVMQHLSLGYFGFMDDNCSVIVPSYVQNASLQSLLLRGNKLSSIGGLHLAKILSRRQDLVEVDLEGNCLDNDGAMSVSAAIRHSPTLHTLLLATNHIGEKGLVAVADSIMLCPALVKLTLWGNSWSPNAAKRFGALPTQRLQAMELDFEIQKVDGVAHVVRM